MRFFVLIGSSLQGPLTPEQVRLLPGMVPDTPVCPEDRDHKRSANWSAAASYPQLLADAGPRLPERDGGVLRFWQSAIAKERAARALVPAGPRRARSESRWLWLSVLVLPGLIAGWLALGAPRSPRLAPEPPARPATVLDQAAPLLMPLGIPRDEAQALLATLRLSITAGRREIVLPADGRRLKYEARFSYDQARRELRPTNKAGRELLDIRQAYRKP
jgi:hypothetical protein